MEKKERPALVDFMHKHQQIGKIRDAVEKLHIENTKNPTQLLVWVCDRQGNFEFYYEANSLFFWNEKKESDYVFLDDSSHAFCCNDEEIPDDNWDFIEDFGPEIEDYQVEIFEHIEQDARKFPFELITFKRYLENQG